MKKEVNYKKLEIIERIYLHDIDLTSSIDWVNLPDLIEFLQSLQDQYSDKYYNIFLDIDHSYDYFEIALKGERLETEEEYTKRIKAEESRLQKEKDRHKTQEEKDRATYARLKKKFEGK